ncbi:helix-turn-helix domain-containing protein [Agrobacterium rosae]|uniref:helix-turn-helix domain-containing protein n=1 Tax=Agrobacterium rosae TaxID=1972867 RepID=UPI002A10BDBA|nr:helix-turn-helix domain-containing protein [Agrobacterium rosae]MDX8315604.1 helix-turn-helix domain-containing protein [Agrobacterium rosae]
MNQLSPISYEDRAKARAKEIRLRLMGPQKRVNVFRRGGEEPVEETSAQAPGPHLEKVIVFIGYDHFNAHVSAWKTWQREQADVVGSPLRCYIRQRAIEHGYTFAEIVGPSRNFKLVAVRHRIMWEVKTRVKPTITFPELGRLFGGRDHTSALWAVNKVQKIEDERVRAG